MTYATECDHDNVKCRIRLALDRVCPLIVERFGVDPRPVTRVRILLSRDEYFGLWYASGYRIPTPADKSHYMSAGCMLDPDLIAFCTSNFPVDVTDHRLDEIVAHEFGHRLEPDMRLGDYVHPPDPIRKLKAELECRRDEVERIIREDIINWTVVEDGIFDASAIEYYATSHCEQFAGCFAAAIVDDLLSAIVAEMLMEV